MTPATARRDDIARLFVFSPASSYPTPFAKMVDRSGRAVHTWTHSFGQPAVEDAAPSFLCGWNHVEVAPDGGLFAIVPLHAVLRLDRASTLVWAAELPAHHDVHVGPDGSAHVLTEHPRRVDFDGSPWAILDNTITRLSAAGRSQRSWSLYDVLSTDSALERLVREKITTKRANFLVAGGRGDHPWSLVRDQEHDRPIRTILRMLRQLPGSPCDILHANSLEPLKAHPRGAWEQGQWLVSFRELDLVAVLDLDAPRVVWWWGPGELSGQHQPSALADGTVLLFDNGVTRRRSRVIAVDPVADRVVWEYTGDPPDSLFSAVAGGCEGLSSGNVLITDAQAGRAFEVDRSGTTVWNWSVAPEDCPARKSRATLYRLTVVRSEWARRALGPTWQEEPLQSSIFGGDPETYIPGIRERYVYYDIPFPPDGQDGASDQPVSAVESDPVNERLEWTDA